MQLPAPVGVFSSQGYIGRPRSSSVEMWASLFRYGPRQYELRLLGKFRRGRGRPAIESSLAHASVALHRAGLRRIPKLCVLYRGTNKTIISRIGLSSLRACACESAGTRSSPLSVQCHSTLLVAPATSGREPAGRAMLQSLFHSYNLN